jgi:caffeoyl-CoA O-methyltransferase
VLPRIDPGGLIAVDNTLWSGRVLDPMFNTDDVQGRTSVPHRDVQMPRAQDAQERPAEDRMSRATRAIVAFNDHVARDPRVEHVLLSVRDGIMLVRKRAGNS